MNNDKVKFVRIRGRIVPIKPKQLQAPAKPAETSTPRLALAATTGTTTGFTAGNAIYRIFDKYQKKYSRVKTKATLLMRKIGKRNSKIVSNSLLTNAYDKVSRIQLSTGIIRRARFFELSKHASIVAKTISKYKLPASVGVGVASGISAAYGVYNTRNSEPKKKQ